MRRASSSVSTPAICASRSVSLSENKTRHAGELQSECKTADESKRQKCDQASSDESRTIASSEFRHLSPPSCQAKPGRSERGSLPFGFSAASRRPRHFLIRVERARRGLTLRSRDPRAVRLLPQQVRWLTCSPRAAPALPKPGGIDTPGPDQPSANARFAQPGRRKTSEGVCAFPASGPTPFQSLGMKR